MHLLNSTKLVTPKWTCVSTEDITELPDECGAWSSIEIQGVSFRSWSSDKRKGCPLVFIQKSKLRQTAQELDHELIVQLN